MKIQKGEKHNFNQKWGTKEIGSFKKIVYNSQALKMKKRPPKTGDPENISNRAKVFLRNVTSAIMQTQKSTREQGTPYSFKKLVFKRSPILHKRQHKWLEKTSRKYLTAGMINKIVMNSEPMKQKLKKIIYKTVEKKICQRPKPKKTCEKECYRIIDGEKQRITETDPHYFDLCGTKEEEKEEKEKMEEFECDEFGRDISLLGRSQKTQVNFEPSFNLNFIFNDQNQVQEFVK